jgi:hypothetical protein
MARHHGQLHSGKPQSYCGSIRLADESFTYERNRWYTGSFGCGTCPQHGGRTAPSTPHPGDYGVGSILFELGGDAAYDFAFLIAMSRAEYAVVDKPGIGETLAQLFFQNRKNLIAAKYNPTIARWFCPAKYPAVSQQD